MSNLGITTLVFNRIQTVFKAINVARSLNNEASIRLLRDKTSKVGDALVKQQDDRYPAFLIFQPINFSSPDSIVLNVNLEGFLVYDGNPSSFAQGEDLLKLYDKFMYPAINQIAKGLSTLSMYVTRPSIDISEAPNFLLKEEKTGAQGYYVNALKLTMPLSMSAKDVDASKNLVQC